MLQNAQKIFSGGIAYFRCSGIDLAERFTRYQAKVSAALLFNCEGRTPDYSTIAAVHSSEGRCLALMSGLRKRRTGGWSEFQRRRYKVGRQ
eukprot:2011116-Pyramimonas_sp.AAC.1